MYLIFPVHPAELEVGRQRGHIRDLGLIPSSFKEQHLGRDKREVGRPVEHLRDLRLIPSSFKEKHQEKYR